MLTYLYLWAGIYFFWLGWVKTLQEWITRGKKAFPALQWVLIVYVACASVYSLLVLRGEGFSPDFPFYAFLIWAELPFLGLLLFPYWAESLALVRLMPQERVMTRWPLAICYSVFWTWGQVCGTYWSLVGHIVVDFWTRQPLPSDTLAALVPFTYAGGIFSACLFLDRPSWPRGLAWAVCLGGFIWLRYRQA